MKIIIGFSNFSLNKASFSSFKELEDSLLQLQSVKKDFNQAEIGCSIGNDIKYNTYLGRSLDCQVKNFSFGDDKGVQTAFTINLHQKYLKGFNLSHTTEELINSSFEPPDTRNNVNYILYIPFLTVPQSLSFKDNEEFSNHYEKILSEHPTSNSSFYKRATSHFTNLIYHPECEATLNRVTDGFINYSAAFVTCLKALNEFSPTEIINTNDKIRTIKSSTPYDCTGQGKSHPNFKFAFTHNNVPFSALNCEFHIKPSGKNSSGDNSFHHKRLYFGFIPTNDNQWYVAIAAMGPHISTESSSDRYLSQGS